MLPGIQPGLDTDTCDPAPAQSLPAQAQTGATRRGSRPACWAPEPQGLRAVLTDQLFSGHLALACGDCLLTCLLDLSSATGQAPRHLGIPSLPPVVCPAPTAHCCSIASLTVVTNSRQVILSAPRLSPIYLIPACLTQRRFLPRPSNPEDCEFALHCEFASESLKDNRERSFLRIP